VLEILRLDHSLLVWVLAHRVALLNSVMLAISVIGRSGLVWLTIGFALATTRHITLSGFLQLTLAIVLAFSITDYALKPLVARPRPFVSAPDIEVIGPRPIDRSFPSGHAATAFAGAYVLSEVVTSARICWWALAALIAFSRVYLGVHYPLDVIGGSLVGCVCGWSAARLVAEAKRQPHD
jgi:undecaprenyl-diphosphatase